MTNSKILVLLILGLFLVFAGISPAGAALDPQNNYQYGLLNPIFIYVPDKKFIEFKSFKCKVIDLINREKASGKATQVSFYFRDLDNGPWFGIDEKEKFCPASLTKLPVMFAWLELAEESPGLLDKKFDFKLISNGTIINQNIVNKHPLEPGEKYTLDYLLSDMIENSDNDAFYFLFYNEDVRERLYDVFTDLGFAVPNTRTPEDYVNIKEYAGLFRMLYNSSVLNKEMSEKALEYMTKCSFIDGIVAPIPKTIIVAHKFGERAYQDSSTKELHDFGIVYYPGHAYLIGIMSEGKDFDELKKVIRELSALAYYEVDSQLKNK